MQLRVFRTRVPRLRANLAYDPVRDFAPITLIASTPLIVVVHPAVSIKSVNKLVHYPKARPGGLNFASSGTGSIAHLPPEMFNSMAKIKLVHVPYKGTGPASNTLEEFAAYIGREVARWAAVIKIGGSVPIKTIHHSFSRISLSQDSGTI